MYWKSRTVGIEQQGEEQLNTTEIQTLQCVRMLLMQITKTVLGRLRWSIQSSRY